MVEHPILFAGPLIHALRAGAKTQSRRLVLPNPGHKDWMDDDTIRLAYFFRPTDDGDVWTYHDRHGVQLGSVRCPWGLPGHRLWVRETHAFLDIATGYESTKTQKKYHRPEKHLTPVYRVGASDFEESLISKWRPSLHMPRWAARTLLEVTRVRIERLWSITEEDAKAEGVIPFHEHFKGISPDQPLVGSGERVGDCPYRASFAGLWDELADDALWKDNPWVWALSFQEVKGPVSSADPVYGQNDAPPT